MGHLDREISRVLTEEGSAILKISLEINSEASEVVGDVILATKRSHNIFLSGMGKCSFIAGKLAATYSSLGIPSFALNCAHALHGDIGAVREGDVVIVLSKSGDTKEVVDLVVALKKLGALSVAITCNRDSRLAKLCDKSVILSISEEACHLGLAPTTSTTAMLAMGDAIGVVASKQLGVTKAAFRKRHVKGKLGEA